MLSSVATSSMNDARPFCDLPCTHVNMCGCTAETSVFANELKKDNFILVSIDPGWVDTEMGGANARSLGMERAPTDAHYSISTMLKTIKQLKVENSGKYVGTDGSKMDF